MILLMTDGVSIVDLSETTASALLVLGAVFSICFLPWLRPQKKNGVPVVSEWPFLGSSVQTFQSPTSFVAENIQIHGDKFYCHVMRRSWLFVNSPDDLKLILTLSQSKASSFEILIEISGFLLPQNRKIPKNCPIQVQPLFDPIKNSLVPHFAHSVRPPVIQEWIPHLRKVVRSCVQDLKKKAQHRINLFDFARDTISRVTTMLMIGQEAFGSGAFLEEWTALFLEADVE
jgi:hypothetical protein